MFCDKLLFTLASANRFELSELEPVRYIETADVNPARYFVM